MDHFFFDNLEAYLSFTFDFQLVRNIFGDISGNIFRKMLGNIFRKSDGEIFGDDPAAGEGIYQEEQ